MRRSFFYAFIGLLGCSSPSGNKQTFENSLSANAQLDSCKAQESYFFNPIVSLSDPNFAKFLATITSTDSLIHSQNLPTKKIYSVDSQVVKTGWYHDNVLLKIEITYLNDNWADTNYLTKEAIYFEDDCNWFFTSELGSEIQAAPMKKTIYGFHDSILKNCVSAYTPSLEKNCRNCIDYKETYSIKKFILEEYSNSILEFAQE